MSELGLEDLEVRGGESAAHRDLKRRAIQILKKAGASGVVLEHRVNDMTGPVDVVGYLGTMIIAVECGHTTKGKILTLQRDCDIVLHMPYCWTPKFYPDQVLALRIWQEILRR